VRFKPNASVFKDEQLGGINIVVTDRNAFESVRTGLEIATALAKLYPNDWQVDRYGSLLVNGQILEMVKRGDDAETIVEHRQKVSRTSRSDGHRTCFTNSRFGVIKTRSIHFL
jgi:uncharacterized protein YbbC (DUF1343 family)